jgi:hypothetical protein
MILISGLLGASAAIAQQFPGGPGNDTTLRLCSGCHNADIVFRKGLWYSQIGGLSSPPETFMLDGKQHLLATGAGALYLFVLN